MIGKGQTNKKSKNQNFKKGRFGDKARKYSKPPHPVNPEIIEKAKRLLELTEKLKQNPKLQEIKAKQDVSKPTPEAKTGVRPKSKFSDGNIKPYAPKTESNALSPTSTKLEEELERYIDSSLEARRERRPRRHFHFVEEGLFEKEAELERIRGKYGDDVAEKIKTGNLNGLRGVKKEDIRKYQEAGKQPLDTDKLEEVLYAPVEGGETDEEDYFEPEIPDCEWWDEKLLDNKLTDAKLIINESRINNYVEHPVPIEPPAGNEALKPQPLRLTKKEIKKLRTQRRQQREKEKQELVRQGLLEPPKPKVKISNMMRVLADQAATDPTAIEREVRKQMEERRKAHEDRNLARSLTPMERKEKRLSKMFDATNGESFVCVFKIPDMSNTKNQFKVSVNAEENRLTGCCLISSPFSLVVVEGCSKSIRRYKKLMLRRIKWNAQRPKDKSNDEEEGENNNNADNMDNIDTIDTMDIDNTSIQEVEQKEEKEEREEEEKPAVDAIALDLDYDNPGCCLVWEGSVRARAFKDFRTDECRTEGMAKRYLAGFKVEQYWDLAKQYEIGTHTNIRK